MSPRNYGYITNKERNRRVRESNQNYVLKKLFIILTVTALIVLVVLAGLIIYDFVQCALTFQNDGHSTAQDFFKRSCEYMFSIFQYAEDDKGGFTMTFSWFGWFITVWAVITIALAVISMILILRMKSPKAAKANISRLQSAALSGKKIDKNVNAAQVYRERGTNTKKLQQEEAK